MSKHTPGPWVKDYGRTLGHIKAVGIFADSTPTLCLYDFPHLPDSVKPCAEANGYLIAAAPELYEGCRKALTCASMPDYVRDVIRDAIAKAEGRAE